MAWNSGIFTREAGASRCDDERIANEDVNAAPMDNDFNDMAEGINECFPADGSKAASGNWDLNGYELLNVAQITGNVTFTGNTEFSGVTTFTGQTTHNNGINVNGTSTFVGNTSFIGTPTITGGLVATGTINTNDLSATGTTTLSTLSVGNTLSVGSLASFSQSVTCNAGLNVNSGLFSALGGIRINSNPPSSSGDTGNIGTITWDENYFYVATDDDVWMRIPLSSF